MCGCGGELTDCPGCGGDLCDDRGCRDCGSYTCGGYPNCPPDDEEDR